LAFALLFPSVSAWAYFVALSPAADSDRRANPLMQAVVAGCKVIQFSLPVLWLSVADRAALRPRRPSWRGVPAGVAFGATIATLALALYFGRLAGSSLFRGAAEQVRSKVAELGLATPAGYLLLAGFIAVVHSLLEEYYWRWFVYGRLRRHLATAAALVLAGLAFMGHHVIVLSVFFPDWFWAAVVPFSLGVAAGGIAWAWLYERSGSLLGPWLSHLIVDAALMAIGYDLLFRR
jgi:membrane protease YdiL (CAAX protease family)